MGAKLVTEMSMEEKLRASLGGFAMLLAMETHLPGLFESEDFEEERTLATQVAEVLRAEEDQSSPLLGLTIRFYDYLAGVGGVVTMGEILRGLADSEGEPSGSPENMFEAAWESATGVLLTPI